MVEKQATRDAYGKTLVEIGRENTNIVVLDADLSKSTKTAGFAKAYPERFFNCGIAEQNMLGVAAGLAAAGKKPFVSSFAVFATGRAFEQIRNGICYANLPVVIAATHAGISVGEDGGTHQSIEDMAIMRSLPNMTVICPADGPETAQAVRAAAQAKGPVYLRMGRSGLPVLYEEQDGHFQIGKGHLLKEGADVALIACGLMVEKALAAAALLAEKGIQAAVCNMASIKPLDEELLGQLAERCGAFVTCEEHNVIGGLGSAVSEYLSKNNPCPVAMVGVQDQFGQSGNPADLMEYYGLTAEKIVEAAQAVMRKK